MKNKYVLVSVCKHGAPSRYGYEVGSCTHTYTHQHVHKQRHMYRYLILYGAPSRYGYEVIHTSVLWSMEWV